MLRILSWMGTEKVHEWPWQLASRCTGWRFYSYLWNSMIFIKRLSLFYTGGSNTNIKDSQMLNIFPNLYVTSTPFTGVILEVFTFVTKKFTSTVLLTKLQKGTDVRTPEQVYLVALIFQGTKLSVPYFLNISLGWFFSFFFFSFLLFRINIINGRNKRGAEQVTMKIYCIFPECQVLIMRKIWMDNDALTEPRENVFLCPTGIL